MFDYFDILEMHVNKLFNMQYGYYHQLRFGTKMPCPETLLLKL